MSLLVSTAGEVWEHLLCKSSILRICSLKHISQHIFIKQPCRMPLYLGTLPNGTWQRIVGLEIFKGSQSISTNHIDGFPRRLWPLNPVPRGKLCLKRAFRALPQGHWCWKVSLWSPRSSLPSSLLVLGTYAPTRQSAPAILDPPTSCPGTWLHGRAASAWVKQKSGSQ